MQYPVDIVPVRKCWFELAGPCEGLLKSCHLMPSTLCPVWLSESIETGSPKGQPKASTQLEELDLPGRAQEVKMKAQKLLLKNR